MSDVTSYQKGSKIVEELERQLEADNSPAEFLGKICNFLMKNNYYMLYVSIPTFLFGFSIAGAMT